MTAPARRPLISAGLLLGAGLGGFADGILFHQILQVHNMLSARIPVVDLVSAKVNMAWDGYFHAAVWMMTCLGLYRLFRAGGRPEVPWSGRILLGAMLVGWGLFNAVEGTVDHFLLGVHHVLEYAESHFPADAAFVASGLLLMAAGWGLIRRGTGDFAPTRE